MIYFIYFKINKISAQYFSVTPMDRIFYCEKELSIGGIGEIPAGEH